MSAQSGRTLPPRNLTSRTIETLRAGGTAYRVPDARCMGLGVRVGTSGKKTFDLVFRISKSGKVKRVSLGACRSISLEDARIRANELTRAAQSGRDLIAEEATKLKEAAARPTVRTLIEKYLQRKVTGRLRTEREIERRLYRSLEPVLATPAADIKRRDIRNLLDEVSDAGLNREAEKRRQVMGTMFRWAVGQDYVEHDPTLGLEAYDPGTPRDRVLSMDEIRSLWNWLELGEMPTDPADVLRLQLLTGARCGEISGMSAEEIDTTNWLWKLPATRSKNGKERITPIVGAAKYILEIRLETAHQGPFFQTSSGKPLKSSNIGNSINNRIDHLPIAKFSTHDLRRTVATGLTELGIALDLVAAIIGHEAGGRSTRTLVRHYIRTEQIEQKRAALLAWDRWMENVVAGASCSSNVTNLSTWKAATA